MARKDRKGWEEQGNEGKGKKAMTGKGREGRRAIVRSRTGYCNAPQARHRRPPLTGSGTGGLKGRKQGRDNNGICAGPDRRLYCAPRGASTVLVVDPKTDKLSFIRRPKDGQAKLH